MTTRRTLSKGWKVSQVEVMRFHVRNAIANLSYFQMLGWKQARQTLGTILDPSAGITEYIKEDEVYSVTLMEYDMDQLNALNFEPSMGWNSQNRKEIDDGVFSIKLSQLDFNDLGKLYRINLDER